MLSLNSDIFLDYIIGTLWAGGIANPINIRWAAAEILASLSDSGTRLMLVDDTFLKMAEALRDQLGSALHCIYTGAGSPPAGMTSYEELLAQNPAVNDAYRQGDDPALLLYTGGTTGRPKGVVFSHTNMASAALAMRLASGTGPIYLHAAPMFHMGDIQMMFAHFLGGGHPCRAAQLRPAESNQDDRPGTRHRRAAGADDDKHDHEPSGIFEP